MIGFKTIGGEIETPYLLLLACVTGVDLMLWILYTALTRGGYKYIPEGTEFLGHIKQGGNVLIGVVFVAIAAQPDPASAATNATSSAASKAVAKVKNHFAPLLAEYMYNFILFMTLQSILNVVVNFLMFTRVRLLPPVALETQAKESGQMAELTSMVDGETGHEPVPAVTVNAVHQTKKSLCGEYWYVL